MDHPTSCPVLTNSARACVVPDSDIDAPLHRVSAVWVPEIRAHTLVTQDQARYRRDGREF
eukprot:3755883-Rhodomonas_salina.1